MWIKGQPTENGQYHVVYKLFNQKNGQIVTELHVATIEKNESYEKGYCFISNTICVIQENKIVAWMPIESIPVEFYDAE